MDRTDGDLEELISSLSRKRIVVIGDAMLDRYVAGRIERISPEAPIPVLKAETETENLGGAANAAEKISSVGCSAILVAAVGRDDAGARLRSLLRDSSMTSSGLVVLPDRLTTIKTRFVAGRQQVLRVDSEGRTGKAPSEPAQALMLNREEERMLLRKLKSAASKADGILISDYGKGVCTPNVIAAAVKIARAKHIPLVVDPCGSDYSVYRGATLLTPNVREAEAASGVAIADSKGLRKAGRKLLNVARAECVAITRGPDGIALFLRSKRGVVGIPTRPVEVFDVTGAGDAAAAMFAVGLASGMDITGCARLANLAGGVIVTQAGCGRLDMSRLAEAAEYSSRTVEAKIVGRKRAVEICSQLRLEGKTVVFTNGCFDLFHPGHLKLLEAAAGFGDVLVVGLNSDRSVRELKGRGRPLIGEKDRARLVGALHMVDHVVVFDEKSVLPLVKALKPDVLVKGGDYDKKGVVGADFVESYGGRIRLIAPLGGMSTSGLVSEIRARKKSKRRR